MQHVLSLAFLLHRYSTWPNSAKLSCPVELSCAEFLKWSDSVMRLEALLDLKIAGFLLKSWSSEHAQNFSMASWVGRCDDARKLLPCCHNKSVQSNLERGPHRGTIAHVCCKVPIGYYGMPQTRPQKYPFPWTDPQTPLPASSLDPSDLGCQMASGFDLSFFHSALDRPTHWPTDRPRESSITIVRSTIRAMWPNNTHCHKAFHYFSLRYFIFLLVFMH